MRNQNYAQDIALVFSLITCFAGIRYVARNCIPELEMDNNRCL